MIGKFLITLIFIIIGFAGVYHENLTITLTGIIASLVACIILYQDVKEDYIKRYDAVHAVSESEVKE